MHEHSRKLREQALEGIAALASELERLERVLAHKEDQINSREEGVLNREKQLNNVLEQHKKELAAANLPVNDLKDKLAKEQAAHTKTREALVEAQKEIKTLHKLGLSIKKEK